MKTGPKIIIIVGAVCVVAVGAFLIVRPLFAQRDGIHYVTRPVGRSDISATVSETGTVNPVNTVTVGSEVSGTIRTLGVDFNSRVRKGEVMATLDPTTYQAAVDSAQASLSLAEANLNSAQVNVGKMKALSDMANLTVQRDDPLLKQGLINQNQMDTDNTAAVGATQDYLASQAAVHVAEAQVGVARAQLAEAQYNLSKTVIESPMDGIVMARNVSIGQTVAASLQTPTLFSLATNLTDMQVDTSVDEADAGSVQEKASARFTVTAYGNEEFAGTVQQVRINPIITQNVVTYDAVVAVHDTSGRLLPGMTAQVTIDVGKQTNVLSVPIAAVLYRPLQPQSGGTVGFGGGFGAGVVQTSGGAPAGQAVAGAPGSQVTVWVLVDGRPTPRQVVIGLTDGKNIEIRSGDLQEGDLVILGQRRGSAGRGAPAGSATATAGGTTATAGSATGTAGTTASGTAGAAPAGAGANGNPAASGAPGRSNASQSGKAQGTRGAPGATDASGPVKPRRTHKAPGAAEDSSGTSSSGANAPAQGQ
ncbi:MAG: efflux RND transporter periplasmic adaptor subunit [Spirochaetia bacterium]